MSSTDPAVPTDEAEAEMVGGSFRDVEILGSGYFDEALRILLFDNGSGHIGCRMGVSYLGIDGIDAIGSKVIEVFCSRHLK